MVVMDKRMDEMDKRLMTETAPAGQINQVELGASDVLLAKGVGVDHLYIDVDHIGYIQTNQILNVYKTAKGGRCRSPEPIIQSVEVEHNLVSSKRIKV